MGLEHRALQCSALCCALHSLSRVMLYSFQMRLMRGKRSLTTHCPRTVCVLGRGVAGKYTNRAPRVVSLVSTELMVGIRNLVGSVHWWHPETKIVLYQTGELSVRHQSELSLWDNVQLIPLHAVVEPLCVDNDVPLVTGAFAELRAALRAMEQEGRSPMLTQPEMEAALATVKDVQPLVTWHATKVFSAAVYFHPASYCSGWIDNVFKSLLRDGFWFVQDRVRATHHLPTWNCSLPRTEDQSRSLARTRQPGCKTTSRFSLFLGTLLSLLGVGHRCCFCRSISSAHTSLKTKPLAFECTLLSPLRRVHIADVRRRRRRRRVSRRWAAGV
jgi:hypothetical protein